MAQMVSPPMVILPAAAASPNAKDSRWLTLEVCREFQRSKCSRTDTECKFAHPPPHVEVQNGRVVACFDSIKGKCQRKDPPCKYLHPPQHLREQLLQNGRNNLILKNMQLQAYQHQLATGVLPVSPYPGIPTLSAVAPAASPGNPYSPYIQSSLPAHSVAMTTTNGEANQALISQALHPNMLTVTAKAMRADKFETVSSENGETLTPNTHLLDHLAYHPTYFTQVCREFLRGTCSRSTSECRYAHPAEHILVDSSDNHVTVCMDFVKSKCSRDYCKYFHPPTHLQALVRATHARNQANSAATTNSASPPSSNCALSSVPGAVPYKRIAVGDIGKGGIPLYPSNHFLSTFQQPASIMPLQQTPSYIPVPFTGHPPSMPRF